MTTAIARLGALAFDVVDIDAWRRVLRDILGLEERPIGADGVVRFRLDELEHRIALHPASEDRVRLITWDVDTLDELESVARQVETAGIAVEWVPAADNDIREATGAFRFTDPEGFPVEVRFGATWDHRPFRPSSMISGFVTGDLGLGHVVLICSDYAGTVRFYREVLGFELSDYIVWDGADATFLHVNGRHHSLALMNECFGQRGGQFNHFMLEVGDLDDTGRAYHAIVDAGIPLTMDFGRHTNDGVTSFYFRSPSGFQIEIGSGGVLVDDESWEVKTWRAPARWGHHLVP